MSRDVPDLSTTLQLFERQAATGWATQQNGNRTNENNGLSIIFNITQHSPDPPDFPSRPTSPATQLPRQTRPRQKRKRKQSRPRSTSRAPQYQKSQTNTGEGEAEAVRNGYMESSPKLKPSAQQQLPGLQQSRWNQQDPQDGKKESKSRWQSPPAPSTSTSRLLPTSQGSRQYSTRPPSERSIEAENETPEQATPVPAVASVPQLTTGLTGAQLSKQYPPSLSGGKKKEMANEPTEKPVPIQISESLPQLHTGLYNSRESSHLDEIDGSTRVENNIPKQLMVPNSTSRSPVEVGPQGSWQVIGMDLVGPEDKPREDENTNPEQPTSTQLFSQHTTASQGVWQSPIGDINEWREDENNVIEQLMPIKFFPQEEIAPQDVWSQPDLPNESSESKNPTPEQSPPTHMPLSQSTVARLEPSERYKLREPGEPRKPHRSRDRSEPSKPSSGSRCRCVIL